MKVTESIDKVLKIAWICHFTTAEIQDIIKPSKKTAQFAPWISNTIKVFEDNPNIELHVIAPHRYIANTKHVLLRGVHYHFFNAGIPFWGRHWPSFFEWDVISNYRHNKRTMKVIVDTIKPDVIHLQGAENAYYSSSILQFLGKYPVVVNIQMINPNFSFGNSRKALLRKKIADTILTRFKHFSIRTETMKNELLSINPSATIHWVRYQVPILQPCDCAKEYDVVFFGRIGPTKGIEDMLKAVSLYAKQYPGVSLCIIGSVNDDYRRTLEDIVAGSNVKIDWKGQLFSLDEVHREVCKAKIAVLPSHYDIIPGTIIESMMLGIPVVSYKTGSIPELNTEKESVLLVERGDIQGLAINIERLLCNEEFATELANTGRRIVLKRVSSSNILGQHMQCYHEAIEEFNK
jgi:glycosyltransferase involved in cell wall biosynthesis